MVSAKTRVATPGHTVARANTAAPATSLTPPIREVPFFILSDVKAEPPRRIIPSSRLSPGRNIFVVGVLRKPLWGRFSGNSAAGALEPHLTLRFILEGPNRPQSKLIPSIPLPFIELIEQNPRNTQKLTIPMTSIEELLNVMDSRRTGFENRNTCPRGSECAPRGLIFTSLASKSLTFDVSSLVCRPNAGLMRAGFSISRHQGFAHGQGGHHQGQAGFQC
jgi:hypothetical protein